MWSRGAGVPTSVGAAHTHVTVSCGDIFAGAAQVGGRRAGGAEADTAGPAWEGNLCIGAFCCHVGLEVGCGLGPGRILFRGRSRIGNKSDR